MQGWGGQLHYIRGARLYPINMQLDLRYASNTAYGPHRAENSSDNLWHRRFFGGNNSYHPAAYTNAKPAAVFQGKLYQVLHNLNRSTIATYVTRFDGSGIFINEGDSNYEDRKAINGRGSELLSPSGVSFTVASNDLAHVVHNGNLFMVGNIYSSNFSSWESLGWAHGPNQGGSPADRKYGSLIVTSDQKRIATPITDLTGTADESHHLHACDAVSYKDDIYYSNWLEILRFPGGSGVPTVVYSDSKTPSHKGFVVYPAQGYSGSTPVGDDQLLFQTGSGVIHRLNTDGSTTQITDLGSSAGSVRPRDNFRSRLLSSTAEPGRSSLLVNFNNQLHSFFTTATSGYNHFIANGNPSGTSNWTDSTASLPGPMKRWDSNVFAFVDEFRNRMYVAQVTMGEVGVVGHAGIHKGPGGVYIHEYTSDGDWREVFRGVPGLTPRGLLPLMNTGPYVTIPSGTGPVAYKCSDYAIVEYTLHDLDRRPVDVDIKYSINEGVSWHDARRFKTYDTRTLLGSGVTNLPTTPEGVSYDFYWHYVNDIGFNNVKNCLLRIRPKLTR